MPQSKGHIWKFYEEQKTGETHDDRGISQANGRCKPCGNIYTFNDGSTSGIRKHLLRAHPREFKELEKHKAAHKFFPGEKSPQVLNRSIKKRRLSMPDCLIERKSSQARLSQCFKCKSTDPKQLRGDLEIMKLLARINLLFSFVVARPFKEFIHYLDPKLKIKAATTYSRYKLPLLYDNVKMAEDKVLETDLLESSRMASSIDIWTSRNFDPYHSLSVHYIDKEWTLNKVVVSVSPFSEKHTADTQCQKDRQCKGKVVADLPALGTVSVVVTHDNAANVKAAIPKCTFIDESLLCVDQTLNLAIKYTVDATTTVDHATTRAQRLAEKTHKSHE
ncbi:uncharacterized protein LOC136089781 [Hydra vulgaris]|uniref:Uncharacterized protein LOC136089781 n=1 Tax=Hydra vulgaris TaxID=6087 RepID=A0ABM4DC21_HYDVU